MSGSALFRYSQPLSLLMLDVDDFKSYNDKFGHQAGEETRCCGKSPTSSHEMPDSRIL